MWNRLKIYVETTPTNAVFFLLNADVEAATGAALGTGAANANDVTTSTNAMTVGEYIDFEANGGTEAEVKVTVIDAESNTMIGSWTFLEVQARA